MASHPVIEATAPTEPVACSEAPILACALASEEGVARRAGARAARVGLGASRGAPVGQLVAFGLAGSLVPGVAAGTLLTARRIVDERGAVIWEGDPVDVPGAQVAVLCATDRVVDDPAERQALAGRTGAVAVEMESHVLARTGRLIGCVRAVVDGPDRQVGKLAGASTPGGDVAWGVVVQSFITEPLLSARTARAARRALASLERAAAALAGR